MTSPEQALSEFMDAWNAGRRPSVAACLEQVAPNARPALAEQLDAWLAVAPTPAYDDEARAAIRADPVVARVQAAVRSESGLLGLELPRLRSRASLSVRALAERAGEALGLAPGDAERTAAYLERVEGGEHDARRLSRRLLDALAGVLGVDGDGLAAAASLAAPRPQGVGLFRAEAGAARDIEEELDALTAAAMAPAPAEMDEVDRLFCAGPDG